jgi:hypothetical protein
MHALGRLTEVPHLLCAGQGFGEFNREHVGVRTEEERSADSSGSQTPVSSAVEGCEQCGKLQKHASIGAVEHRIKRKISLNPVDVIEIGGRSTAARSREVQTKAT